MNGIPRSTSTRARHIIHATLCSRLAYAYKRTRNIHRRCVGFGFTLREMHYLPRHHPTGRTLCAAFSPVCFRPAAHTCWHGAERGALQHLAVQSKSNVAHTAQIDFDLFYFSIIVYAMIRPGGNLQPTGETTGGRPHQEIHNTT